ncbi:MAG: polysaccharide biosynthesis/export family protein [Desulfobacterales bacterium]|nr:MAG: polysaccharide biosynthesis/export family protein [Desulfobacterales bacterium]
MQQINLFHLCTTLILCFCMCACGVGGEVVKVTEVNDNALNSLREVDLARLEQIKKARDSQGIDPTVSNMIQKTPHFSVSEYFMEHPEARGTDTADYKVGGYDVLNITVYEEPDLSRNAVRVSADGYISFPLIGRLEVANLTTSEIEELISLKLAEQQYLLDAHVSVMVTEYNSKRFLILGAVKNPGSYSLKARERVLDGISRAGGIDSEQKASKKAMIIRTEDSGTQREHKVVVNIDLEDLLKRGNQISNIFLGDKDVLYVPTAAYFYIIGQVNRPGSFAIPDREITLVEAIGMAGGFTRIASRNKTRIIRVEDGIEKIIQVKVDAITEAGKKIQDVVIQPNDVIVVPESFF